MTDDLAERARTWLAGRYQGCGIYRGKPKLIAKHAQELVDELLRPAAAAALLHDPTPSDDDYRDRLSDALTDFDEAWTNEDITGHYHNALLGAVLAVRDEEIARLRAERDQFRDASVMYAAMVAERNAERDQARRELADTVEHAEPFGECRPDCDCGDHQGPRSCGCHVTGEEARTQIRELEAECGRLQARIDGALELVADYTPEEIATYMPHLGLVRDALAAGGVSAGDRSEP